jgi:hypothetical protein
VQYKNNTRFLMRLGTRLLGGLDLAAELDAAHKHIASLETTINALHKQLGQPPLATSYAEQAQAEKAKRKAAADAAAAKSVKK